MEMTLDTYLATKGVSSPISSWLDDKLRFPHGLTQRQNTKRIKDAEREITEYHNKRCHAKLEYYRLVSEGQITVPSKESQLIRKAQGHPDNASVQASRRMLVKRGIFTQDELNVLIEEWDKDILPIE